MRWLGKGGAVMEGRVSYQRKRLENNYEGKKKYMLMWRAMGSVVFQIQEVGSVEQLSEELN